MYLWFSFIMFMVGGAMAMAIRLELFQPGIQFFNLTCSTSSPPCTA